MQRVAARCEACWHKRYRPDAPRVPHTCNRHNVTEGRSIIVNPAREDWCSATNATSREACSQPAPYRILNKGYGQPRCERHAQLAAAHYKLELPRLP